MPKRVKLDMLFADSEIFDKEITELIRAKVREIVRSEIDLSVQEYVEKIFIEKKDSIAPSINSEVCTCVANYIRDNFRSSYWQEKVGLNEAIQTRLKAVIDQKVADVISLKVGGLISDAVMESVKKVLGREEETTC